MGISTAIASAAIAKITYDATEAYNNSENFGDFMGNMALSSMGAPSEALARKALYGEDYSDAFKDALGSDIRAGAAFVGGLSGSVGVGLAAANAAGGLYDGQDEKTIAISTGASLAGGAAGSYAGAAAGSAVASAGAGSIASSAAQGAVQGAVQGSIQGGANAAMAGDDIASGAAMGAGKGAATGAFGGAIRGGVQSITSPQAAMAPSSTVDSSLVETVREPGVLPEGGEDTDYRTGSEPGTDSSYDDRQQAIYQNQDYGSFIPEENPQKLEEGPGWLERNGKELSFGIDAAGKIISGGMQAYTAKQQADAEERRLHSLAKAERFYAAQKQAQNEVAKIDKAKQYKQNIGKARTAFAANGVMLEGRAESAPSIWEQDQESEKAWDFSKMDYNTRMAQAIHNMNISNYNRQARQARKAGNLKVASSLMNTGFSVGSSAFRTFAL